MFCTNCGKKQPDGSSVCPFCGYETPAYIRMPASASPVNPDIPSPAALSDSIDASESTYNLSEAVTNVKNEQQDIPVAAKPQTAFNDEPQEFTDISSQSSPEEFTDISSQSAYQAAPVIISQPTAQQVPAYNQPQAQPRNYGQPQQVPAYNQPQAQPRNYNQPQHQAPAYNQPQAQPRNYAQPQHQAPAYNQQQAQPRNYTQPQQQAPVYNQPQAQLRNYNQPQQQAPAYNQQHAQPRNYTQPQQQAPVYNQPRGYAQSAQQQTAKPKKKGNGAKILIICIAAALVLLIAIAIPVTISVAKSIKYNNAVSLMESGNYSEAKEEFDSLGKFRDSKDNVEYCEKGIIYNEAQELFDSGDFEAAEEKFYQAGNFLDAESRAMDCQKAIHYQYAEELYAQGDLQGAGENYSAAADYLDAAEKADKCLAQVAYNDALTLIEVGDYDQAKELLQPLNPDTFPDRDDLITECVNRPIYNDAMKAYEDGLYYTAYTLFDQLGDYLDSQSMLSQCEQEAPSTGVLYKNSDYSGSSCTLKFETSETKGIGTFVKIYSTDDTLVATIFIKAGSKGKISLAAGNYKVKASYGFTWYGETEMFGNSGFYQSLSENGSDVFTFKKNFVYTFYLWNNSSKGDTLNSDYSDLGSF